MNKQTQDFLDICLKYGLKKVLIGMIHPIIPESNNWPLDPRCSVFGLKREGSSNHNHDGWPAIWRATEEAKIGDGCGNSNQYQISKAAQEVLERGAYQRINGKWKKIDSEFSGGE